MSDFPYADRFTVNRVLPERGRSREEVRRWRNLRPGEARRVLEELPRRLMKLAPTRPDASGP